MAVSRYKATIADNYLGFFDGGLALCNVPRSVGRMTLAENLYQKIFFFVIARVNFQFPFKYDG